MGLTSIHIHICYFILTQLILNYKFSGTITGMVRVILYHLDMIKLKCHMHSFGTGGGGGQ